MDANAPRRRSARLAPGGLSIAAAVIGLVAIVAIASSGSTPSGGVERRRPSDGLLDTFISLFVVVLVVSAVLSVVLLSFFSRYRPDGTAPKRRAWWQSLVGLVVAVALIALLVRSSAGRFGDGSTGIVPTLPGDTDEGAAAPSSGYDPEFAVWPVVGVVLLSAIAIAAWWLSLRGRRAVEEPPESPAEALADVLAATLDDLRAEHDPRRAVIRAYARMERSVAAAGLPRAPAEAPEEYLARVLDVLPVSARAAARLTALFAWARFSPHDVRPEMKDEAIDTLEQIQVELEAAEAEQQARLEGVLT
jgi:hypothetical protein